MIEAKTSKRYLWEKTFTFISLNVIMPYMMSLLYSQAKQGEGLWGLIIIITIIIIMMMIIITIMTMMIMIIIIMIIIIITNIFIAQIPCEYDQIRVTNMIQIKPGAGLLIKYSKLRIPTGGG